MFTLRSLLGALPNGRIPIHRERIFRHGYRFGFVAAAGVSLAIVTPSIWSEHKHEKLENSRPSLGSLIRAYLVFFACSIPPVVTYAPNIISISFAIPGVKQVAQFVIKNTFFDQFVGGETAQGTLPLLQQLRREGKGVLLAYSVEVDESAPKGAQSLGYKRNVVEMVRAVDVAGDFEDDQVSKGLERGKTWVAVKLTALLPSADSLSRLSAHLCETRPASSLQIPYPHTPSPTDLDVLKTSSTTKLTSADVLELNELYQDLRTVCARAKERGVAVIIDAEHTWYTPAIDAFTLALTREFNQRTTPNSLPLVFGTYQSYLRRGLLHLQASLEDADKHNYVLGVKLVRGAYQPLEVATHKANYEKGSPTYRGDADAPVWYEKPDTDATYNASAALLVSHLKGPNQQPGVLFGTHNRDSCDVVLSELVKQGLATQEGERIHVEKELADRLTFGQLMGMCDQLTQYLTDTVVSPSPIVLKYIPYGGLDDVIPYLARRAVENRTVLGGRGGAADERRIAGAEIRKRLFGGVWHARL